MTAQARAVGVDDRGRVRLVGRYAIYAPIGSGGMATVHLGRLLSNAGFARVVAIKRLHPQYAASPEFVRAFLDEAFLAARVRHPNVLPTLDVIAEHEELLIVMEYVAGESLIRLLKIGPGQWRRVPPAIAASIIVGTLQGLHAAHEAVSEAGAPLGLVHRDVSPHNIIVGTDGVARVLDFGIAKAAGRFQSTPGGELKGKLAYMAPEHLMEGKIDRRSDLYAASVVLWEALTGRPLFQRDDRGSTLAAVLAKAIPAPDTIVDGIPPALQQLLMRGLSRNPDDRFATAREYAVALESHVSLATSDQVGRWVQEAARDTLAERAALVTVLETAPDPAPGGGAAGNAGTLHAVPDRDVTYVGRTRLRWAAAIGATAICAAVAWQLPRLLPVIDGAAVEAKPDHRPRVEPLPARTAARSRAPVPVAIDPAVTTRPAPAPRAEQAPRTRIVAHRPLPRSAQPRTRAAARSPTTTAPAAPAPAPVSTCDPPYTVDARGIQRLKPECL